MKQLLEFYQILTAGDKGNVDQNNSYEIAINGFQVRKISSSTQVGEHPNFGLNAEEGFP